jgi:hypothetical protein
VEDTNHDDAKLFFQQVTRVEPKATTVGVGTGATLSRSGTSLSNYYGRKRHVVRVGDLKENCAQCGVSRHKKAAQLWRHHRAGVARLTNASDICLRRLAAHAE